MMVPRELFDQIGGLVIRPGAEKEAIADLSSRVRRAGRNIVYQPLAQIIHRDGLGKGNAPAARAPVVAAINRPHFLGSPGPATTRGHVLVIDHWLPTPDQDAGSLRMMEIVRAIRRRGHHVAFVPASLVRVTHYAQNLQRLGIEVAYRPYYMSVDDYLEQHGHEFDLVIISRRDCLAVFRIGQGARSTGQTGV